MKTTQQILQAAKAVSLALPLTTDAKNQALLAMADLLVAQQNVILEANAQDMDAARGHISEVIATHCRHGAGHSAGGRPA